jgi:hypothetical protein
MVILLFVLYKCVLTVREESESDDDDDDVELFSGLPTFGLGHLEARLSLD